MECLFRRIVFEQGLFQIISHVRVLRIECWHMLLMLMIYIKSTLHIWLPTLPVDRINWLVYGPILNLATQNLILVLVMRLNTMLQAISGFWVDIRWVEINVFQEFDLCLLGRLVAKWLLGIVSLINSKPSIVSLVVILIEMELVHLSHQLSLHVWLW